MIVLFTDYGLNGPYLGQVRNVLHRDAPGVPVINLFANAPAYDPKPSAYLLSAYGDGFPPGTVFFAVVDPGVGGERQAGVLEADGNWYVGPDNGVFEIIIRRAVSEPRSSSPPRCWDILWRPERLSATFHGRDLFAPIAARLARGETPEGPDFRERPINDIRRQDWPDDLSEIIYLDDFGNAITGLRYSEIPEDSVIRAGGLRIPRAKTFSDVPEGTAFCYENSSGLLEIAVNRGRADSLPEITLGCQVTVSKR